MDSDSEQSDEYQPSDVSDEVGSEDDSDEDYSSIAEDESESGEPKLATCMLLASYIEARTFCKKRAS